MELKVACLFTFFVLPLVCTVNALHPRAHVNRITFHADGKTASGNVEVAFYGEALCPGCQRVWTDVLPLVVSKVGDIIDFRWIPYGNAHRINGSVACQHGVVECEVDTLEGCAMRLYPFSRPLASDATWLFLHCVETHGAQLANAPRDVLASCAGEHNLDLGKLDECGQGPLGRKLQRRAGWETAALDPPHTFVPWVTVNGAPLRDHPEDLLAAVCAAYRGPHAPPACAGQAHPTEALKGQAAPFDTCPLWS